MCIASNEYVVPCFLNLPANFAMKLTQRPVTTRYGKIKMCQKYVHIALMSLINNTFQQPYQNCQSKINLAGSIWGQLYIQENDFTVDNVS